jgi:hypothetical protein
MKHQEFVLPLEKLAAAVRLRGRLSYWVFSALLVFGEQAFEIAYSGEWPHVEAILGRISVFLALFFMVPVRDECVKVLSYTTSAMNHERLRSYLGVVYSSKWQLLFSVVLSICALFWTRMFIAELPTMPTTHEILWLVFVIFQWLVYGMAFWTFVGTGAVVSLLGNRGKPYVEIQVDPYSPDSMGGLTSLASMAGMCVLGWSVTFGVAASSLAVAIVRFMSTIMTDLMAESVSVLTFLAFVVLTAFLIIQPMRQLHLMLIEAKRKELGILIHMVLTLQHELGSGPKRDTGSRHHVRRTHPAALTRVTNMLCLTEMSTVARAMKEWPFDLRIYADIAVSLAVPVVSYLLRI